MGWPSIQAQVGRAVRWKITNLAPNHGRDRKKNLFLRPRQISDRNEARKRETDDRDEDQGLASLVEHTVHRRSG